MKVAEMMIVGCDKDMFIFPPHEAIEHWEIQASTKHSVFLWTSEQRYRQFRRNICDVISSKFVNYFILKSKDKKNQLHNTTLPNYQVFTPTKCVFLLTEQTKR